MGKWKKERGEKKFSTELNSERSHNYAPDGCELHDNISIATFSTIPTVPTPTLSILSQKKRFKVLWSWKSWRKARINKITSSSRANRFEAFIFVYKTISADFLARRQDYYLVATRILSYKGRNSICRKVYETTTRIEVIGSRHMCVRLVEIASVRLFIVIALEKLCMTQSWFIPLRARLLWSTGVAGGKARRSGRTAIAKLW